MDWHRKSSLVPSLLECSHFLWTEVVFAVLCNIWVWTSKMIFAVLPVIGFGFDRRDRRFEDGIARSYAHQLWEGDPVHRISMNWWTKKLNRWNLSKIIWLLNFVVQIGTVNLAQSTLVKAARKSVRGETRSMQNNRPILWCYEYHGCPSQWVTLGFRKWTCDEPAWNSTKILGLTWGFRPCLSGWVVENFCLARISLPLDCASCCSVNTGPGIATNWQTCHVFVWFLLTFQRLAQRCFQVQPLHPPGHARQVPRQEASFLDDQHNPDVYCVLHFYSGYTWIYGFPLLNIQRSHLLKPCESMRFGDGHLSLFFFLISA